MCKGDIHKFKTEHKSFVVKQGCADTFHGPKPRIVIGVGKIKALVDQWMD